MVSAAGLYRLVESQGAFLDVIGGIRYWSVDSELSLGAGWLAARKVSNKEGWIDPLVGLKGLTPIGESKFFVSVAFSIGGFGVGSDFMWDANINLGYQWTKSFTMTVGYRYLDVDYEDGDFLYDVAQNGLVLGLSWRFYNRSEMVGPIWFQVSGFSVQVSVLVVSDIRHLKPSK